MSQNEGALQSARSDLEALANQLKELNAEIDAKVNEQSAALRTRAKAEDRKALEDHIKSLEEDAQQLERHLQRLRARIRRLEKEQGLGGLDENEKKSMPLAEQMSSHAFTHLVPKMLPTFGHDNTDVRDPEEFLSRFSRVVQAHNLSLDDNWSRLLPLCLGQLEADWVAENLNHAQTWQEAKELFMNHFAHPLRQTTQVRELWSARQRKNESLRQYCDRFQKLMRSCNVKDDNMALTELFISTLPHIVQRDIQITKFANPNHKFNSVAEVAVVAVAMEAIIPGSARPEHTASQEEKGRLTIQKKMCSLHGNKGHTTEECFTLKKQEQNGKQEPKPVISRSKGTDIRFCK